MSKIDSIYAIHVAYTHTLLERRSECPQLPRNRAT